MLKKIWAWWKKTYNWYDYRDFGIIPLVVAMIATFCELYLHTSKPVTIIGMFIIYIPLVFHHMLKYHKEELFR